ncbi:MAG TPA: tetratricopeptide repeat protein [Verrucomicrobiae bacterium]|nr:tetratricopeptide repeat protein [Verrucomicrobiae bacterium]
MPRALAISLSVISAALVLWTLYRCVSNTEEPRRLIIKWIATLMFAGLLFLLTRLTPSYETAFAVPGTVALIGIVLAAIWAPHIGEWFARPLTSMFDGGEDQIEPAPLYSIAINKMRKGEYQAAAFEIKQQLLKFPDDFKGQHMLAELQAEHLNDLPGAQVTIERIIAQPGRPPQEIALVLNQIADWHLKYAQDIEAARAALQQIPQRFPDSELAHLAQQRMAHLGTTENLLASHDRPRIAIPRGPERLGLMKDQSALVRRPDDPAAEAGVLVKHLEENPLDHEARAKLAWIYAEHFQQLDMALEQMEQLVQDPHQPPRQRISHLNTIADLQIKFGKDIEAARTTLMRIIDLNPTGASAETARNRMDRLPLELRATTERQSIKMS